MIVLTPRPDEKAAQNPTQTAEVCSIRAGSLRLDIAVRDEKAAPPREPEGVPTLTQIKGMLEKRIEIARDGIAEAGELLRAGNEEDARMVLEKIDEDLHLLRRRIRVEFEKAGSV